MAMPVVPVVPPAAAVTVTRSGRRVRPPERLSPVEDVMDDSSGTDATYDPDNDSQGGLESSSDDDDNDDGETSSLRGFIVDSDAEEDAEEDEEDGVENTDEDMSSRASSVIDD